MMGFKTKSLFFFFLRHPSEWQDFKSEYIESLPCDLCVPSVGMRGSTTTSERDDEGSLWDAF